MASIFDIRNPWRDELIPASFRGAQFHCETHALDSGRRMVQHEFPKRDLPYAEDMGHKAIAWTVRGYCIAYPVDVLGSALYQRDYRTARDDLIRKLSDGQSGILQVQTFPPFKMWCERFRVSEEEKLGGYCTIDMTFIEAGEQTFPVFDTYTAVINAGATLRAQVLTQLWDISSGTTSGPKPPTIFVQQRITRQ
jgi:prophage DNA circulation protein